MTTLVAGERAAVGAASGRHPRRWPHQGAAEPALTRASPRVSAGTPARARGQAPLTRGGLGLLAPAVRRQPPVGSGRRGEAVVCASTREAGQT